MEGTTTFALAFALDAVVNAIFLWAAMKVTARLYAGMPPGVAYCSYANLLIVVLASSLVRLVPAIGLIASIVVMFVLLWKFTDAEFGELVAMVVIAKIFAVATLIALAPFWM